jgi:hypothetical protein
VARRDRIRRRRSPFSKWAGRVLGVAGTAVLLACAVVIATMVLPADDEHAVTPAPAATPERAPAKADKRRSKPRLTARQREERRRAVDEVRRAGYTPVDLGTYDHEHLLRVLIGKPVGTAPPGLRAFFFVDDEFIGNDATAPSGKLRPGRRLEREITLVYTLYEPGDRACCPKGGDTRVHFRWTGDALEPREAIPPDAERMPS